MEGDTERVQCLYLEQGCIWWLLFVHSCFRRRRLILTIDEMQRRGVVWLGMALSPMWRLDDDGSTKLSRTVLKDSVFLYLMYCMYCTNTLTLSKAIHYLSIGSHLKLGPDLQLPFSLAHCSHFVRRLRLCTTAGLYCRRYLLSTSYSSLFDYIRR